MKFKLVVFFCLWVSVVSGQYKQMLHKPYKEKVNDIGTLYQYLIDESLKDSTYTKAYTQKMKNWALANNDKELALEAELLNAYAYWHIYNTKQPDLIDNMIDVAAKAKNKNILHVEARAANVIALHYWRIKNYEKAFEWLLRSASILDKIEQSNFPNMAHHLNFIGRCYYYFRDYDNAIIYYNKSSKLTKTSFNNLAVTNALNSLGLCYQQLDKIEESNQSFLTIINDTSKYKNKIWQSIASGNLAYNYYLNKNYKKAIPLFKKDISEATSRKDYGLAAGSAIALADVYLKQHQYKKAKQKIDEAYQYITASGQIDRLRKLFPIISKWHAAKNNAALSISYLDSAMHANEKYNEKYNSLIVLRANQKVAARERKIEIEKLKTESKQKITQRNIAITTIVILLIASVCGFIIRNKYLLRKQQIKELELDSSKKALENAKEQLKNLTLKVRKDSELIEELTKIKSTDIDHNIVEELKNKNILTQKDWQQYQKMFNEVYPYFMPKIVAFYPELSQAEIRCLCLEKLSLSNNEMSLILGVSLNTIRVTKHRVRKKLNVNSQKEMENVIEKLTKN